MPLTPSQPSILDPLDGLSPEPVLDLRARVAAALGSTSIDRGALDSDPPLLDAIDELSTINSGVDTQPADSLIPHPAIKNPSRTPADDGPRLARDQAAVLEIARNRVVSFAHLRRFVFSNRSPAVITRRMQELERTGYITTWEDRALTGGHPHYGLLTETGLRWADRVLRDHARGEAHEQLVDFMLRARARRPLVLAPHTAPAFLPHQAETNLLTALLATAPSFQATWATTWHRPFPNEARGVALPQPDAVMVLRTPDGRPHLAFLEHDRGQESPGSFAERKSLRYQLLLDLGLAPELFGFETFSVLVTVADPAHGRPLDRLRALQEVSAATPMMRFTLAAWLEAHPEAAVWLTAATAIHTNSLNIADHAGLLPLFSNLQE